MSTTSTPGLVSPYKTLTPSEAAAELGVPLSQRLLPDLSAAVPRRLVTEAEAEARGWSWYWDGSSACRYGHVAARRTANEKICSDCDRVKDGKEPIYGKSKTQRFYSEPRRKPKDPSAPVVIQAPAAAAAPELPKRDANFLAALAETGAFDTACERTNISRGQIEARASSSEPFRHALDDLLDRLQIPRTLKAPSAFAWSPEIERTLIRHFVDSGLIHTAQQSVGVSPSEYYAQLEAVPAFAAAIEAARPLAAETLKERMRHAASAGDDRLFKILSASDKDDSPISNMSHEQINAEIERMINQLIKMNVIATTLSYKRHTTGEIIDAADLEIFETTHSRAPAPAEDAHLDLIGAE